VSHHQHMQSYIRQRQAAGDTDTEALLRSARDARHFRDWDELRYSLRSVEQYLYRSPFMQVRDDMLHADAIMLREEFGLEVAVELQRSTDGEDVLHGNSSSHVGSAIHSLLGVVYIVVAADDQLPSWLRTSPLGGFVRVVRHAELLHSPAELREQQVDCRSVSSTKDGDAVGRRCGYVLPMFNSRSIETLLHRVRGLSRFFVYVNNDVLISQPMSPLDLLRPLAPPRQELRFAALKALHPHRPATAPVRATLRTFAHRRRSSSSTHWHSMH